MLLLSAILPQAPPQQQQQGLVSLACLAALQALAAACWVLQALAAAWSRVRVQGRLQQVMALHSCRQHHHQVWQAQT
jgi:hypothetical protein